MIERSEIRPEDEPLQNISIHLATLRDSHEPVDEPVLHARLLAERKIAITNIAENLVDPKHGDALARFITTKHNSDPSSQLSVYAYWSILRHIMMDTPTAAIPMDFLNFFQDLALEADEPEMEFTAKMMATNKQELESTEPESTAVSILVGLSRTARTKLDDLHLYAKEQSTKNDSEANIGDAARIAASFDNTEDLLRDIRKNQFYSTAGMVAAHTQQDTDRLIVRAADPKNLLADITDGNFFTKEGLHAAKLQQDSDRLTFRQNDSTRLRGDILGSRFCTREGVEAAKTQHDTDRLTMRINDPDNLLADINHHFFFTAKGIADARIQQDADRLTLHEDNIAHLMSDIHNGRFLTQEGINEAQAIINRRNY